MDNVTHTLIGVLIGETVARLSNRQSALAAPVSQPAEVASGLPADLRRNLIVTLAAIGSNLPDADLLYSYVGDKANYLLHHRGHTHTLLGALVLSALTFLLVHWGLKRRHLTPSRAEMRLLAGVLFAMPLLHIAMDFTNNYGVHPFWPVYNGWFYGDSVFIVEPLFWAAAAPLVLLLRTAIARIIVACFLLLGLVLGLLSGLMGTMNAVALSIVMIVMLLVTRHARPLTALLAGIALWLGTTGMFVSASFIAGQRVDALARTAFPEARLLDRVLTPMPVNPVCWEAVLIQQQDNDLLLRRGMLSILPPLVTAEHCPSRILDGAPTAPLRRVEAADGEGLKWAGEVSTPIDRLETQYSNDCLAAAALRFIRAPWLSVSNAGVTVLGDMRYDREKDLGFAEVELGGGSARCPRFVPNWTAPRADLLD
jgi:inner membrane protein